MNKTDLMPAFSEGSLQRDLCLRWAPSGSQIDGAKFLLKGRPSALVFVPIALVNKEPWVWTEKVEVRPVDGAWLAVDHDEQYAARETALDAAKAYLADRDLDGVASYAIIKHDGSWSVWDL